MPDSANGFLKFIHATADALRAGDAPPSSLADWHARRTALRANLERSWGPFPRKACPLEPRVVGELRREGYRVEKVVLQTRPGVWLTANVYVPTGAGRRPAVLCVHGHWRGAKQDPVVQSRCIGLARLGFCVLAVDAFGAGERGLAKALGEYHGEMVAATLWPTGLSLSGLQVYENMRAVDYLQSRPEVDPERIGITGASGGGNQTMYAAAYDERFRCAVPVCSVGTYRSYLGAACCMCEIVPAALTYTEEWGLLALVAPRALLVINATQDAFQFSAEQADISIAAARKVFELHGAPDRVRHTVFESKHDYSRPMREAMYGWMTLHLKGEGRSEPIPEPQLETEEPEELRCFPGDTRPADFVTLPRFAAQEARRLLATQAPPDHLEWWQTDAENMLQALASKTLGTFPARGPATVEAQTAADGNSRLLRFESEAGVNLVALHEFGLARPRRTAVLLDFDGLDAARGSSVGQALRDAGWDLITLELRATGQSAVQRDQIGRAIDHNTAEWSMWIGRPLLGQWVWDTSRLLDVIGEVTPGLLRDLTLIGRGPAGVVALATAALERRVSQVAVIGSLATYVSDKPYEGQRLGIMPPGILSQVGDIAQLAALCAPRRLVIAGGVLGEGRSLTAGELGSQFAYTQQIYRLLGAPQALVLTTADASELVQALD